MALKNVILARLYGFVTVDGEIPTTGPRASTDTMMNDRHKMLKTDAFSRRARSFRRETGSIKHVATKTIQSHRSSHTPPTPISAHNLDNISPQIIVYESVNEHEQKACEKLMECAPNGPKRRRQRFS
eukprot:172637_1